MKRLITATVLALATGVGAAQDGDAIVKQVVDHYGGLEGVSVRIKLDQIPDPEVPTDQLASMYDLIRYTAAVVRPNRFAFRPEKPADQPDQLPPALPWVYSDGRTYLAAHMIMGIYEKHDAPSTIAAMLATRTPPDDGTPYNWWEWEMLAGAEIVLELMSIEKPEDDPEAAEGEQPADEPVGETILTMLESARYQGTRTEDDQSFHVFLTTEERHGGPRKVEIHVASDGPPWVIALKSPKGEAQPVPNILRFTDWKTIDELPKAAVLEIDDEWEQVDDVMRAFNEHIRSIVGDGSEEREKPEESPRPQPEG